MAYIEKINYLKHFFTNRFKLVLFTGFPRIYGHLPWYYGHLTENSVRLTKIQWPKSIKLWPYFR